ncbi:MAG TPA: sigma 54-interacting transcriptional regulator, partial [Longimicrobium sp.]|nr:sigma 54-interacting transcriptional regulator [Longimicrobium sp.]
MISPDDDSTLSSRTEGLAGADLKMEPVIVEAIEGPAKGTRIKLSAGTVSVGAHEGCDLVLSADSAVSRQHLSVELMAGGVRVRDLGSRNGTTYLGAKIEEARVPVGGSVRVGRTVLRFTPVTQPAPVSVREQLHYLIGRSLGMQRLFALLEKLGPQESTVLIRGETGSGKDAVARTLHALSPRAQGPFVVFDCGAVNANLIESELFGHAKGAYTGADRTRAGAIESAHGGTLFLDEIGELPLELQPKLLRVLEAREFRRVGEDVPRKANVRVVSATHRDLEAFASAGKFRSDLYYRLAVAILEVPPLRNRPEDIPLLAAHFAKQCTGVDVQLAPATLAALQCDPWPGNVRELRNAVERAVTLGSLADAPSDQPNSPTSYKEARDALLERFERDYLQALLTRHGGNVSAAAREA